MWRTIFGRGAAAGPPSPEGGTAAAGLADVTPAEARRRQRAGSLLVDVREPAEWDTGHAPGAVLIPLGQLAARQGELPRDKELIIVCRSGNRSGRAATQLRQAGFSPVRNMAGGMVAWARSGLPLAR
jgi:rhodanese-related sulfurtransferase